MHDEQLRDGLAAWLEPIQRAPAPDLTVIRRRLRRRRARQAAAGIVLGALAAATAALVHVPALLPGGSSGGPGGPGGPGGLGGWPPCRASQLRVDPAVIQVPGSRPGLEQATYLLQIGNTGRAGCSLDGWPALSIASPRALRTVPIRYETVIPGRTSRGGGSRMVEPTPVEPIPVEPPPVSLLPRAWAVAAVTVTHPGKIGVCVSTIWSVTPPHGSSPTLISRSSADGRRQRDSLLVCRGSVITVSPVYPAAVPATASYPPTAGAGPQAMPSRSQPGRLDPEHR